MQKKKTKIGVNVLQGRNIWCTKISGQEVKGQVVTGQCY